MTATATPPTTAHSAEEPLLSVRDLRVTFTRQGEEPFKAVDGVSFDVRPGQTVGLVGESGCGKSVTSLAIMGLLPKRGNRVEGEATFEGTNLLALDEKAMRERRGRDIAMIFQDPLSSLNPVVPVGLQVTEVLERHRGMSRKAAQPVARDLLKRVGIPDPDRRLKDYPHQMSGGMRQRALIAMALACKPRLLIADEPTTALDVTIQAQILYEAQKLCRESGTALIWITHDLSVVAGLADRICVMYAGRIVEQGTVDEVLDAPRHPYTHGLIGSVPSRNRRGAPLAQIPGMTPALLDLPPGCAFRSRCPRAAPKCIEDPALEKHKDRLVRCFYPL
jgi:peptide/nickel transport system ATP-binding protein